MKASASPPFEPLVQVDKADSGIRVLTLRAPGVRNALSGRMLSELTAALHEAVADDSPSAVVLTAADPVFCVGADVRELRESLTLPGGPAAHWRPRLELLAAAARQIASMPLPVVCAVNGQAAGAGFALALCCDLRVASQRAAFFPAYGAVGCSSDGGFVWMLTRVVGHACAIRVLLEQPVIRAQRALELGLVHEVVPHEDLLAEATDMARRAAASGRHAVGAAKRLALEAQHLPFETHMQLEHEEFLASFAPREPSPEPCTDGPRYGS